MTANLFIISAASGAGKTSLIKALLESEVSLKKSVSFTTRAPRPGEVNGEHYHFVDELTFANMRDAGDFLESAFVHGAHYGTSQSLIQRAIAADQDMILEIDWQGAAQVRKQFEDAISIFILPPSLEVLSQRLNSRGQDSQEVIKKRLAAAQDEMRHVSEFDYVTINDKFEEALEDIRAIIRAHRLECAAQLARHAKIINTLI